MGDIRKRHGSPETANSVKSKLKDNDLKKSTAPSILPSNSSSSYTSWSIVTLIISILAVITRFWNISDPQQVVFDEVHFGKFASYYLERTYYFDVHPPFGKLLLALVGWCLGYDGHYHFDKIGEDYIENNVPYVGLRLFPAFCGAAVVPVCFLTLKELGLSLNSALFGAILLLVDNALIAQSRLILLDSMLMIFCVLSTYCWIRFYKERHTPFAYNWWLWLSLTGVSLAMATGVKMVGLFVVAAVGVATLYDLWDLLDINKGLSGREFMRHFSARALCLIVLPMMIYLSFFYIHFAVLIKSGPGDAFMSSSFQTELLGNDLTVASTAIPYYSNITFMHKQTKNFLHSHVDRYPLRYVDDRVSSQGQQVTGYPHKDLNNIWVIEPVDATLYPGLPEYKLTEEEEERNVRYVRKGDLVRLKHVATDTYLLTHDVASPLTTTNMEITTVSEDESQKKYANTVWKLDTISGKVGSKLMSKKDWMKVKSDKFNVSLFTSNKSVLPEWGYKQLEINGEKKSKDNGIQWFIEEVTHERIVNGTEIGQEAVKDKTPEYTLSFLQKFFELQGMMIAHNAGLTKPHPYSSGAITWPFVLRGISFWESKKGLRQIYLLGNPIVWWISIVGTLLYPAMFILDRILLQRGIDDFGGPTRRWWNRCIGFLWIAWALHWIPFFLMGRMLFLHHYLPSFIFSTMITACMFEFIGRILNQDMSKVKGKMNIPLREWLVKPGSLSYTLFLSIISVICIWSFHYFSPLTYGLGFESKELLRSRKWMDSWDLQHA